MKDFETIYKLIGKKVKHIRKLRNMTQEHLAELSEIHPKYLGEIERGECKASVEVLYKISQSLKLELSALFSLIK